MAKRIDYVYNPEWNDGAQWVALAGEDFPEGEEELFKLWLDTVAFELGDRHARAWIKKMPYSTKMSVWFLFEDWVDDHPGKDKDAA